MERHIKVLSGIFLLYGGILFIDAFENLVILNKFDTSAIFENLNFHLASASNSGFDKILQFLIFIETYFDLIACFPALIGGWGLLHHKPWGRYTVLALSMFLLLVFPIGTFIGLYTIWALTKPEAVRIIHA